MDFFDFEEASHNMPFLDLDAPTSNTMAFEDMDEFSHGVQAAKAELEAQRVQQPNPFANTKKYGTIIKLKMINNREVEGILWDQNTDYPMFRAREACELCARMGLDCFLASRGALISGCTCCISLYRACSFTHDQMPEGFRATFPGIAEDAQVCQGTMTEATKKMKSFEDAKTRKSGSRFPREAVKVLKKWLSDHADHPYPNEREKNELKQLTGLKRGQITNWLANARRRSKPREASDPSSPVIGAIDIPNCPGSDATSTMNPLDRWKHSPVEHEAALATDIARAITTAPIPRNHSATSLHNSRSSSRKASSEEESNWSAFRAPSVSSFETRDSTNSDFSFASSRSQKSKASYASSQERRRRRRAPTTSKTTMIANKSKAARVFQCTFCTDTFPIKYDWQRHEKSLHLALERWVCCPEGGTIKMADGRLRCAFCPMIGPSDSHLETHNFSACHEKTVQERTFFRKDHLRQHLKLMHEAKFDPAMESWKSFDNEIKSRCGFCPSQLTTWQQRIEHLAAHFRNGSNMSRWHGGWGFEPHVEKLIENAIPPYLIGFERSTMKPFVAREQTEPSSASITTPGLSTGTSLDDMDSTEQFNRDTNCWFRLEQELTKYVLDQRLVGLVPSDKEIQDHARVVIYGDPDPLDWTCADNATWLEAFKHQIGIGPAPAGESVRATIYVPMTAPYVIKGGLKKKKAGQLTSPGECTPGSGSLHQSPHDNVYGYPPVSDVDNGPVNMDIDFDNIDFASLDMPGLGDLSFDDSFDMGGVDVTPMQNDPLQCMSATMGHKNMFGDFGLPMTGVGSGLAEPVAFTSAPEQQHQLVMSQHDLNQPTEYMAGFQ